MNNWYTVELMASERQRDLERMLRQRTLLRQACSTQQPGLAARWLSRHIVLRLRRSDTLAATPRRV